MRDDGFKAQGILSLGFFVRAGVSSRWNRDVAPVDVAGQIAHERGMTFGVHRVDTTRLTGVDTTRLARGRGSIVLEDRAVGGHLLGETEDGITTSRTRLHREDIVVLGQPIFIVRQPSGKK